MKIVIWGLVFLCYGLITTSLKNIGIHLGAIPIFVLATIAFIAAKLLCAKWEVYSTKKAARNSGMTSFEYVKSQIPTTILKHLESEKSHPSELKHYLDTCVKDGSMSKAFADILIDGYTE